MRAFFRAVMVGTLAGAWLPLIVTVLIALSMVPNDLNGEGNLPGLILFAISPVIVTLPIVLGCSLLIGLPSTWLLLHFDVSQKDAYLAVGIASGSLVPIIILALAQAEGGWWLAILGAFSGAMTAASWFDSTVREPGQDC